MPLSAKSLSPQFGVILTNVDITSDIDHATFDDTQQLSTGIRDVFVNGTHVIENGTHTGASPGMFVKGPGA